MCVCVNVCACVPAYEFVRVWVCMCVYMCACIFVFFIALPHPDTTTQVPVIATLIEMGGRTVFQNELSKTYWGDLDFNHPNNCTSSASNSNTGANRKIMCVCVCVCVCLNKSYVRLP
jgi:hypothetical protein